MINKISDKIVFSGLNLIKNGKLNITTFQNKAQLLTLRDDLFKLDKLDASSHTLDSLMEKIHEINKISMNSSPNSILIFIKRK